ncbi:hypothetical protein FB451DRAFT_508224 [Mycena latifolia]|nr:hypothetical protein FB451DRAFT_508224 [Mycena latifolia]
MCRRATRALNRDHPPSNAAPEHSPSLGVSAALSPAQKKMRLELKRYVGTTFRNVCGVGVTEDWPDPDVQRINEVTGEAYPTPNFAGGVTDAVNIRIFAAVAN